MEVKQVLHLNRGDGDLGHPKTSLIQKSGVAGGKKAIREAIQDYYKLGASSDVFVVADLGCSSSTNTLSFVSDVITAVTERCKQLGRCPPMFLAFLNDLPGRDFSTLFRSLPKQWSATGGGRPPERCFVAGVPGSFLGRLFPSNSVHLFHSAFAAHFLSQVPPELESGQIVNRGWVYTSRSGANGVSEAYYKQFQRDFSTFLRARAEEMVIGGRLLMFLMGRGEGDLTSCMESYIMKLMAEILVDMASKGLIEEETMDYFHFPIYFASASEVEVEIQKEGSFSIKCLEVFPSELPGVQPQSSDIIEGNDGDHHHLDACRDTKGVVFARSLRAILEPMLVAHMGGEILETLFKRFAKTLDKYFLSNKAEFPTLLVSLERIYA